MKLPENEQFDRTVGGQDSIGETIACFGSKNGGLLLIGQRDLKHGGEVVGITESIFQSEFRNAKQNVHPAPLTEQRLLTLKNGRKLALIRIQGVGNLRPCAYNSVFQVREGDSKRLLQPDEVRSYHLRFGVVNAENLPTHATKDDLDQEELHYYADRLEKTKENVVRTILSQTAFVSVRGVVVLGKSPDQYLEGAFIEIQKYANAVGAPPVPIGEALKLSRPARQLIEEAAKIIAQNLPVSRTYAGVTMVESPAISFPIIRETITNAVAHRNYQSHEHIRIRIFDDGFDISNPAVLTSQMWADIQLTHTTYHPNEGLYTFLKPALLYEGRGEGIWKIKEELQRLGKVAPEFKVIGDVPSTFYVRISLSPAKARDARFQRLSKMLLERDEITTSAVMKRLNVSRVTALQMLDRLTSQGLLEHQGAARSSKYIIKIKSF